jgi:hypothetical protein
MTKFTDGYGINEERSRRQNEIAPAHDEALAEEQRIAACEARDVSRDEISDNMEDFFWRNDQ